MPEQSFEPSNLAAPSIPSEQVTKASHADSASGPIDEPSAVAPAGKFRIYLGAAAGVGKTVAMLDEGQRRRRRGADVVAALVETHGRSYTQAQLEGIEVLPRKTITYQGATFTEMDLDAVLARNPQVALVDELAHTNVPGSGRHAKRWEDVLEILQAGIAVITTVNIQHLESLADAVEQMTGARVRERVPDWVVRSADQIELVDSSAEQLRRRILHGNVYPPEKVPDALTHFFRSENLTALRELALRFVADETEEEMLAYLWRHGSAKLWDTAERLMVAVTGAEGSDQIIRRAARMAARTKASLHAVHVHSDTGEGRTKKEDLDRLKQLASDLGASWHEVSGDDVAGALLAFAGSHQITQLVIGATRRSRFEELWHGSVLREVIRGAARVGVDVHVIARRTDRPPANGASS
ncbi:MAG: universal stress protein [Actinobacteria bacterium]|nr:universal stress protein [Actinomycetota bacterium]